MRPITLETLAGFGPIYGPPGDAPAPGVVIVHGGEGPMAGWSHRFALILAAHGFLALPVSYGEGDFFGAGEIRDTPLMHDLQALRALNAHPRCTGTGLFGWSRGGEKVLLLASLVGSDPALKCVAAHTPSDKVVSAFDPVAMREGREWRSTRPDAPHAWVWDDPAMADRLIPGAEIEIERFNGPVFLSVGTADEVWPHEQTLTLAARLEKAGNPADLLVAQGQGHGYDFDTEPMLWDRLVTFFRRHL